MSNYIDSIIQPTKRPRCFLCGNTNGKLDRHEPFGGGLRKKSQRQGLWVYLCHESCHQYGPYSAHQNRETAVYLKQQAQMAAMSRYGWTIKDFIREYGKNFL